MSAYRPSNQSPFGPERYTGGRDTLLFLLSLGVSVGFLLGPARWGEFTASLVRDTALVPFLWLQTRAEEARTSRERFVAVEAERDSAAWAAQAVPALRAENDRLRALLGITPRVNTPYRPAEILRQTQLTEGRTLLLSIGSGSGVEPFDPVVSPDGLIGMVLTTDRSTSVMMTWAHPDFRASAATEDGSVQGTVAATEEGPAAEKMLELHGVPYRDTVATGTLVVTTGLGGIYPRGVPIGHIVGVSREQPGWERIYLIRPSANLGATSHVLVLHGIGAAGRMPAISPVPAPAVTVAPPAAPADTARPPRRRRRPRTDSLAPAVPAPVTTP